MILAINIGNTHTVYALYADKAWKAVWRRSTDMDETEDQLASWLKGLFDMVELPFQVDGVVVSSVVPRMNTCIEFLGRKWLGCDPKFIENGEDLGIPVDYEPPSSVGSDRIANTLGALAMLEKKDGYEGLSLPMVVVDFGTATTVEAISKEGRYLGGAIMPGVLVGSYALFGRAAKVPMVELAPPNRAIGRSTTEALRSGILLGYAGAVDALVKQVSEELGGNTTVIATGGLAGVFMQMCETLQWHEPNLTLEGLIKAASIFGLPVD